jgi:cell division protein ZapA
MNSDKNILKVKIFGTDYPLKVSSNIEYVQRVAEYVDTKMREVHAAKSDRPIHQVAILAALNITDELFQSQKFGQRKFKNFEEQVLSLTKKIELGIKKLTEEQQTDL